MTTDFNLPPRFEAVKDADEQFYWIGKPNFTAFVLGGIPFLIIGLIWGSFDYFFIAQFSKAENGTGMMKFVIPFMALHLFPFWASILNIIRLVLVHKNTYYAVTNKRLMMRSGFWGIDFVSLDYDKIADIEVRVNPIENLLGVGTIQAFSGNMSSRGVRLYDKFIGIEKPYEIFKQIKEVSVDVKTDWNFPNAIRPAVNPGYQTKYDKK